jgi:acyl carrier protein
MTGDDVLAVVREAVAVVLEVDPASLSATTTFASLDADSLALVGVADLVESRLAGGQGVEVRIDDAALARMVTLRDVVVDVCDRVRQ